VFYTKGIANSLTSYLPFTHNQNNPEAKTTVTYSNIFYSVSIFPLRISFSFHRQSMNPPQLPAFQKGSNE